jgi:hypothetical protein
MERVQLPELTQRLPQTRRRPSLLSRWHRRRELRDARRQADARILAGEALSPRTAWRADELTTAKSRRAVAKSLRQLVRAADVRLLPGATPLNRIAVRDEANAISALVARLEALDSPVGARGVLLLDRLVTDGYGPLYVSYRAVELPAVLARSSQALDARF